MGRRAKPSTSELAWVRRYFGLEQATLAAYLGVSPAQVGHLEAGRRFPSGQLLLALVPLIEQVRAPEPAAALPVAPNAPPAPAPLEARRDYCHHHATRLRRELRPLLEAAEVARRWQRALPALLAAAPAGSPNHAWLLRRQQQAAADLDAEASARCHLLRLRAEMLEAEAAALAALLAGSGEPLR